MIEKTISDKFIHGGYVYSYYRFLDRFHSEPMSWKELIEFTNYIETDDSVHKLINDLANREK